MTLKLGYLLPTRQRVMEGEHDTDRILELGDLAEEIGLDSVWIGDSVIAKPRHDPIVLLAAIAARTARIALGTAVLVPMLRNPVLLAHQLATLDRISRGRFVLGVGLARDVPAIRAEFEAVGVPFEKRVGRMLEGLRLCRALWSGRPVDWDGRWKLEGATLAPEPFTPGGPKIWGGGGVPAALRRCARDFDGWFPSGRGGGAPNGARTGRPSAHTRRRPAATRRRSPAPPMSRWRSTTTRKPPRRRSIPTSSAITTCRPNASAPKNTCLPATGRRWRAGSPASSRRAATISASASPVPTTRARWKTSPRFAIGSGEAVCRRGSVPASCAFLR